MMLLTEFARAKPKRIPTIDFSFLALSGYGNTQQWIISIDWDFLSELYKIDVVCRVQEHNWLAGLRLQR